MNPAKRVSSKSIDAEVLTTPVYEHKQQSSQNTEPEKSTFSQRLADKLADKVGSWAFINVQTGILAAWVGMNMMPGVPHWDESPFILLNLVFSFASAYTAPVVLMSQNRQSDKDRKKAEVNYQVNQKAGHNIELLQEKIDNLQSQQLQEMTQIIKQQQQYFNELKVSLVTSQNENNEDQVRGLPALPQKSDGKLPKNFSANTTFIYPRQYIGDNSKVIEKHIRF